MSKFDPQALEAAWKAMSESAQACPTKIPEVTDIINAYRQAECKPFKDAPRDGTDIEAYNGSLWETITVVEGYWHACSDGARFCDVDNTTAYTHYRIPFNPEPITGIEESVNGS